MWQCAQALNGVLMRATSLVCKHVDKARNSLTAPRTASLFLLHCAVQIQALSGAALLSFGTCHTVSSLRCLQPPLLQLHLFSNDAR